MCVLFIHECKIKPILHSVVTLKITVVGKLFLEMKENLLSGCVECISIKAFIIGAVLLVII